MRNSTFKKLISGVLALLLSFSMMVSLPVHTHGAAAHEHTQSSTSIQNEYLYVRLEDTRHVLYTTGGDPDNYSDDNKKLLYDATSKALLNIGNELRVFTPEANLATPDGTSLYSYDYVGDVMVERYISFSYNTYTARYDTVEYKYVVTNLSSEYTTAGVKFIFDTMLGSNDRAPFRVAGNDITTETTYEGEDIPQVWQVFDSLSNPSIVASGTFYTNEAEKPDRVQFLSWGNAYYEDRWTVDTYDSAIGDSGVTVTYDPDTLAPGESRTVRTHYGISAFTPSEIDPEGEIGFSAIAPRELLVNGQENGYLGNPFTFNSWVSNTGNATLTNVEATISLPGGLNTDNTTVYLGDIAPGGSVNLPWIITADPENYDRTLYYTVTISSDGNEPFTSEYSIFLPAVVAPTVQIIIDRTHIPLRNYFNVTVVTSGFAPADAIAIIPYFDSSVIQLVEAEWLINAPIQDVDISKNRAISAWADPTTPAGEIFRFTFYSMYNEGYTDLYIDVVSQLNGALEFHSSQIVLIDTYECTHENMMFIPMGDNVHSLYCEECGYSGSEAHDFVSTEIAPTCSTEGYTEHVCTICGGIKRDNFIPGIGHDFVTTVVAPTCTSYGYTVNDCTRCDYETYENYVEPIDHEYTSTIVEPTCSQQGYTLHTCTMCDDYYMDNYVPTTEHNYTLTSRIESTCVYQGEEIYNCTECGLGYRVILSLADHVYVDTVIAPSCYAEGYTLHECTNCSYSYTDNYTPTIEHRYGVSERVESTCIENGYEIYACYDCGVTYYTTLPRADHTYETTVVEPDCWNQGYTIYTCEVCGDSFIDDYVDTVDHNFEVTVVEPSCTGGGYTMYYCPDCGYTYDVDQTPAIPHNYVVTWTEESTCMTAGYELYNCSVCGDSYYSELPLADHAYETTVIEPTFTDEGYTLYTCQNCGYSYQDNFVAALGHNYVVNRVVEPTCINFGYTEYICTECNDLFMGDVVDALGHNYESEVIDPTCNEEGYTLHTCTRCGDSYQDNFTSVRHHEYNETVVAPTCTERGYTIFTCIYCDYSYEGIFVSKAPHAYELTSVVDPTCIERGYSIYTCTVCGNVFETDYTPTIEHSFEAYLVVPPTCTSEGYTLYRCPGCNYECFDDVVEATPHNYYTIVKPATCVEMGYTTYICEDCGDSYTSDYVYGSEHTYETYTVYPDCENGGYTDFTCVHCGTYYRGDFTYPTGHNYEMTYSEEPTCYSSGYIEYICTKCGTMYQEYVPIVDHKYSISHIESPTCTSEGYTVYSCVYCGDWYYSDYTNITDHIYDNENDPDCNYCGYERFLLGDMDGNGYVDYDDVVALLMNVFFPYQNPIYQNGDLDRNGVVDSDDAVYLQMHLYFPYEYPLYW